MPLAVALVVLAVLLVTMWVAFAKELGPAPADVAIAYERAWDRLDFDVLYDLSGDELRDGLPRARFVAAKRAAYARTPSADAAAVVIEESVATGHTAVVVTRVSAEDGSVRNNVLLERRAAGWMVVGYAIRS
ncbi:MAG: hypothetical protein ACT4OX_16830 [Actinomycetota bacterium]